MLLQHLICASNIWNYLHTYPLPDVAFEPYIFLCTAIYCELSSIFNLLNFIGKVHVNGRVVNKAGTQVSDKSVIEIKAEIPKYVCR